MNARLLLAQLLTCYYASLSFVLPLLLLTATLLLCAKFDDLVDVSFYVMVAPASAAWLLVVLDLEIASIRDTSFREWNPNFSFVLRAVLDVLVCYGSLEFGWILSPSIGIVASVFGMFVTSLSFIASHSTASSAILAVVLRAALVVVSCMCGRNAMLAALGIVVSVLAVLSEGSEVAVLAAPDNRRTAVCKIAVVIFSINCLAFAFTSESSITNLCSVTRSEAEDNPWTASTRSFLWWHTMCVTVAVLFTALCVWLPKGPSCARLLFLLGAMLMLFAVQQTLLETRLGGNCLAKKEVWSPELPAVTLVYNASATKPAQQVHARAFSLNWTHHLPLDPQQALQATLSAWNGKRAKRTKTASSFVLLPSVGTKTSCSAVAAAHNYMPSAKFLVVGGSWSRVEALFQPLENRTHHVLLVNATNELQCIVCAAGDAIKSCLAIDVDVLLINEKDAADLSRRILEQPSQRLPIRVHARFYQQQSNTWVLFWPTLLVQAVGVYVGLTYAVGRALLQQQPPPAYVEAPAIREATTESSLNTASVQTDSRESPIAKPTNRAIATIAELRTAERVSCSKAIKAVPLSELQKRDRRIAEHESEIHHLQAAMASLRSDVTAADKRAKLAEQHAQQEIAETNRQRDDIDRERENTKTLQETLKRALERVQRRDEELKKQTRECIVCEERTADWA